MNWPYHLFRFLELIRLGQQQRYYITVLVPGGMLQGSHATAIHSCSH
jgi:hypothetical protein